MIRWQHDYEAEFEGEKVYLAAMAPLTMCRQPSRSTKSSKTCLYYACAKRRPTFLSKLMQCVKDAKGEPLPIWLRDLQGLLDDYAVARCFTEGMVIER